MGGYGLVLGGGGAKGGYEIGVWKALREMNIQIEAVAGASVGALNGAVIVQDDFDNALKLWTSISMEKIIKLEESVADIEGQNKKLKDIFRTIKNAVASGGLDTEPLREVLKNIIDEKRIRSSDKLFGIVTFSLTDMKPVIKYLKDIPEGQLVDYLMASACFPAFKAYEIDNKKYLDGGIYDNLPVSILIDKNIKDIITVDISGPGIVRKFDKKGIKLINIKASEDLGGVLEFGGEKSERNIEIGYLDTMRAFGKLKGSKFYISTCDEIMRPSITELKEMYKFLGIDWGAKAIVNSRFIVDRVVRVIHQYSGDVFEGNSVFPAMAEITAEQLGIDRARVYTVKELTDEIMNGYDGLRSSIEFQDYGNRMKKLVLSRNQIEFDKEVKRSMIEGKFIIAYDPNMKEADENIKRFRRFVAIAFPKILIANMFISFMLMKREEICK